MGTLALLLFFSLLLPHTLAQSTTATPTLSRSPTTPPTQLSTSPDAISSFIFSNNGAITVGAAGGGLILLFFACCYLRYTRALQQGILDPAKLIAHVNSADKGKGKGSPPRGAQKKGKGVESSRRNPLRESEEA